MVAVAQGTGAHAAVYDEVLSHHEVFRADRNVILVVFLILIECEVLIDVLHIRSGLVRGVVTLGARLRVGAVALRVVDALVAVLDRGLYLVEIGTAEVVVVVVGGVVHDTVEHLGGHLSLNGGEEFLVRLEGAFLLVGEAVEAHILPLARAGGGGESIGRVGRLDRYFSPLCVSEAAGAVYRHTVLVEFLAVVEHILAHLAQVDVEVAAILLGVGFVLGVDEGVEHPELDILDVGHLEVGIVEFAHHAAPLGSGVVKGTVGIEVRVEVVGAALGGIVGEVEHRQCGGGAAVAALVAVWIELAHEDLAHIVVGELVQVALDVSGCERRAAAGEERVDGIPRQEASVVAAGQGGLVLVFAEHGGHAGDNP